MLLFCAERAVSIGKKNNTDCPSSFYPLVLFYHLILKLQMAQRINSCCGNFPVYSAICTLQSFCHAILDWSNIPLSHVGLA